jgi:hypothetical protein
MICHPERRIAYSTGTELRVIMLLEKKAESQR